MTQLLSTIDMPMPLPAIDDIQSLAADGVYRVHGWGSARLEGTPYRDVLEAQTKGLKTMAGGAGDDVYLLNGQWAIDEKAGEGFDWAIGGGGWAITLPENVEGYWNNSTDAMRHLNGNAGDNILVGGGREETIDGKGGNDVLHGGGSGGDEFRGGPGKDTVAFTGKSTDYALDEIGSSLHVTYSNGAVDIVSSDVEFLQFTDHTIAYANAVIGIPEPVVEEPVVEEPVVGEPVIGEPVDVPPGGIYSDAAEVAALLNSKYDDIRPDGSGRFIEVGEGKAFSTIQEACKAAAEGDTIVIHGGTHAVNGDEYHERYDVDAPMLIEHGLQIVGIGDVVLDIGYVTKGALVTAGAASGLYVENITFQGANNRDFNGAGIRHQAGNLTVVDSIFRNNENGVLGGADNSTVTILDSEFDTNGKGDGYSHAIYINKSVETTLMVENSHFHDTKLGHHVKSLAQNTIVRGSVLDDANGTASMAVDVTAGGNLLVENNTIVQAAASDNPRIIYYDTERNGGEEGEVIVRNNIFKNHYAGGEIVGNGTDRLKIVFENNVIEDDTGDLRISDGFYDSFGNTLNGAALPEGDYVAMAQPDVILPASLVTLVPAAPFEFAEGADGVFLHGGWGSHTLEGTDDVDVLKATTKGLKTLIGGAGDDIYLIDGQWTIQEKAGQGFDWAIGRGGWALTLPENVEAYWNVSAEAMKGMTGNSGNNVLIGGTATGESLSGKDGNDTLYGGGTGGDTFIGGQGSDTVLFVGSFADYTVAESSGTYVITYENGNSDTVHGDVEFLKFENMTIATADAASQSPDPVDTAPDDGSPDSTPNDEPAPSPNPQPSDPSDSDPESSPLAVQIGKALPDVDDIPALAADGVYKVHGWGSAYLAGTDGDDVFEAQSKGIKTMAGGAGDDVYLLNGQWAIVENPGEGFDWAVGRGGWAVTLPENVEAYWNTSSEAMRHLTGNAGNNILIGGGRGERIDGRGGDDILFGGGTGGDEFRGGAGTDTIMFAGERDDYEISGNSSSARFEYADGSVDVVQNDVEWVSFADQVLAFSDLLLG